MFYFRSEQKIEFRDTNNLHNVLRTHSVVPHQPGKLCTGIASTLLYVDRSNKPFKVHFLDLSKSTPVAKKVIHTQHSSIHELCYAQDGDKQLLVITDRDIGIFVYNIETDKLEWKIDKKLPGMEKPIDASGVATDGRGHLFVGDYMNGNRCIQMFSVSDGQDLGCLMTDVETLGDPGRICWCEKTFSLVVACLLKNKRHFCVIKFLY